MLLLVVVAHPDDESFGCGSLLASASAMGHSTAVLCATRGEAGESRIATGDLAALRQHELHEASRILGVGTVRLLNHADSGMTGEPAPGTLAAADPASLMAEVMSVIDELRPDVVVTLDASDGHRDHAAMRDATLAAVDSADHRPSATYLWCLARSSMQRWAQHLGGHSQADAYAAMGELGTPDDEITTRLDVAAHLPTRWAAIRAHASQASPYDELPEDLQWEFLATDRLRLVAGTDHLASHAWKPVIQEPLILSLE
jgi:LmbE family N-acetylglucosaminyl deacetylase